MHSASKSTRSTSIAGSAGALEQDGGESVKVIVRIRPINQREVDSGNGNCLTFENQTNLQLALKGGYKGYRFHLILPEGKSQSQVFSETGVHILLDSVLEGYSSTIFAYGQTGSGKTYTMAGVEENLGKPDYISDETDGIIPRGISYMWQEMASRPEKYYVKAAFFEVYNEQLRDLLNPASGVLHCRWNIKNGFFVEDLLVVDCTSIDDLIAVLHEGTRNRKSGSHELNKDSSRSHTIMTVYLISEAASEEGHNFKRYGKVYFVDLAGSERLKETKSKGGMVKETGNINRSLFALGKVISCLGSRRNSGKHIPYRDSKLTMLLMDSLGGSSRCLMIANVSPAEAYAEETMSTLNYATRAMNIKNKPIVQMDAQEHQIMNLRREAQLLKMENEYLKDQIYRATGGMPPLMVDFANQYEELKSNSGQKVQAQPGQDPAFQELNYELSRLKEDNARLRNQKESAESSYHNNMMENQKISLKLENLECAFVGSIPVRNEDGTIQASSVNQEFAMSALLNENTNLKKRLQHLEQDRAAMLYSMSDMNAMAPMDMPDVADLKNANFQLQKRVEQLQKRERELMEHLLNSQKQRRQQAGEKRK